MKNKTRNGGNWTDARYKSFIMSALRKARWSPKYEILKLARVGKKINEKSGRLAYHYRCNICGGEFIAKDVQVDHITPVVPLTGFTDWNDIIERMFCEIDGFQVLCKSCHKAKTEEERVIRKKHKDEQSEN